MKLRHFISTILFIAELVVSEKQEGTENRYYKCLI
jgi:hypothetical protein